MLRCAICQRPLRECCDLFLEAKDENGRDVVICYACVDEHNIPFEDEVTDSAKDTKEQPK